MFNGLVSACFFSRFTFGAGARMAEYRYRKRPIQATQKKRPGMPARRSSGAILSLEDDRHFHSTLLHDVDKTAFLWLTFKNY
jgi:hypothetical protein